MKRYFKIKKHEDEDFELVDTPVSKTTENDTENKKNNKNDNNSKTTLKYTIVKVYFPKMEPNPLIWHIIMRMGSMWDLLKFMGVNRYC